MGKHRRKVPAYPEVVRVAMVFFRRPIGQGELRHLREICAFMKAANESYINRLDPLWGSTKHMDQAKRS